MKLFGKDNPGGKKLEEILDELIYAVGEKSKDISATRIKHSTMKELIARNEEIITHLEHCRGLQIKNIKVISEYYQK